MESIDIRTKQTRFMELLEPLQPRLERFALTLTRSEDAAKDVVAETIMIAFERFDTLRSPQAFLSYLFTIATRVHRKWSMRRADDMPVDDIHDLIDPGTPPDIAADIAAVYKALDNLPEKQREAIVLFELVGLSMKEVQAIQGGTLISVKVRISRGRMKLARLLGVPDTSASISRKQSGAPLEQSIDTNSANLYSVGIHS